MSTGNPFFEVVMKAAILNSYDAPLAIETLADPVAGRGDVVVDVVAAGITSYANRVFDGSRAYLLELPIVPGAGCIGRVRATGPDVTKLKAGDWVYCDPTVRSRDDALTPDIILQGWTYVRDTGLPLHRTYHHGSFAEQMLVPAENVTRLGDIAQTDAGLWCALGRLLVPYGGLAAADLRAGETLVINGATGGFGSAAICVALAMGTGKIVATGRNSRTLEELGRRFGPRVRPVQMTGIEADDHRRIIEVADGPIDCVLDLLPREATGSQVRAAALTVRPQGRVILMGGVGRQAGTGATGVMETDFALPYPWLMRNDITVRGKYMYPRQAPAELIHLIRSGQLDLSKFDLTEFALDDVNKAVEHAAHDAGALRLTVLRP